MLSKFLVKWIRKILEGRSYRLNFPWIGVVNRSQADINKNIDMISARKREREYFSNSPEYSHLANRMGSEHLGKLLSKHLESVIKSRIPSLQSLISRTIIELEAELSHLGRPIAADSRGKLYMIMEICRAFDQIFKEHLDGIRPGGEQVYAVFDNQLPAALKRLQFDKQLSMENVRKLITEADGYQPHLIALEQGYRRLIESTLITIKPPAKMIVDAELQSVRGQLAAEQSRCFKLEVDVAELRQKLQTMDTLQKEVEILQRQKAASEEALAKQKQTSGGVWGWLAGSPLLPKSRTMSDNLKRPNTYT